MVVRGITNLKSSQIGKLPNIAVDDNFGASAAIMVPAPAVSHLETQLAFLDAVPSIRLAVVGFAGRVNLNLNNKGLNSSH